MTATSFPVLNSGWTVAPKCISFSISVIVNQTWSDQLCFDFVLNKPQRTCFKILVSVADKWNANIVIIIDWAVNIEFLRMYLGWSLCTLCFLQCRVKVAVGDSAFGCLLLGVFRALLSPLCFFTIVFNGCFHLLAFTTVDCGVNCESTVSLWFGDLCLELVQKQRRECVIRPVQLVGCCNTRTY